MWSRFVMSQAKHNSYFIVGMAVGLWVSLAVVPLEDAPAPCEVSAAAPDEFEPRREDKPLGAAGQAAGRALQRPRYYTTELGMRGSLLTGVLSSEEALKLQVPILNRTLARLQPALKFFITASAMSSVPGLANVVGFTDTREMLKPFHALKYLADNYLEEYDFFFLVTDAAFVNVRRLTELVGRLSVSRDLYMGVPAPGSQYCDLDGGVLLSNGVLRAVHAALDWCVRNSYSPHHHENVGRCVLHAAHAPCASAAQGQDYGSVLVPRDGAGALGAGLAGAVTARGAAPALLPALHAYCARAHLQRDRGARARLRAELARAGARHPPGYRNGTWPAGLRRDPGLAPPAPDSRFDHLRWTLFDRARAYMPDETRAAGPHDAAHGAALDLVLRRAEAWARARWPAAEDVRLVEGARLWEPAVGLRYRLVLRLAGAGGAGATLRQVEVCRPLGAARLAPVRYVTESARVWLVLPVPPGRGADAAAFLARYERLCLLQDKNTHLYVVWTGASDNTTEEAAVASAVSSLAARHRGATLELVRAPAGAGEGDEGTEAARLEGAARAALHVVTSRLPPDALMLLVPPHVDFNQDFLNRVRMNTISGEQWYLPLPFARHAQYAHPAFRTASGARPQLNTGRFPLAPRGPLLAVYRRDWDGAAAAWGGAPRAHPARVLAAAPLRCVRAPDPAAVLAPRPRPCPARAPAACLRALEADEFSSLDLGARASLARLLLETGPGDR